MRFIKRAAALLTACVMAITGVSVCGAAADYFEIYSGSESTYTMPDNGKLRLLYTAEKSGELTVKISYASRYLAGVMSWGDESGDVSNIKPTSVKASKGNGTLLEIDSDISGFMLTNDDGGGCECTLKYKVKKGYNLITLSNESESKPENRKGGKLTVSVTFGKSKATIDRFSVTVSKGSTLQLGALLSDGTSGSVTWSSSKKSVATVNSKGKVTAKAKGTAVITAKYGDSTLKITVVVK